ncbi:hypothetical protein KC356_g1613 [Hortaea werneckii]|nr:hypothetical protein KC356_g1613 [Hortaea werneckii]
MTSLTPSSTHRPKKVVRYGKASSRSSYNANNIGDFMGDDEPASPPPPPRPSSSTKPSITPTAIPTHQVRVPVHHESPEAPIPSSRKARPRERETQPVAQKPKAQKPDAFDVPSSDDEVDMPVSTKRASPPKIKKRNVLVDDRGVDEEMAPWEKKRGMLKPTTEKTKTPKKGDPKQKPSTSDTASTGTTKTRRNVKEVGIQRPAQSPAGPPPTTAAARLAARRQRANGDVPTSNSQAEVVPATKRPGLATDPNISHPRKRARRSPPAKMETVADVEMNDAPDCDLPPSQPSVARTEMSVFDLPDHSDQEQQTTSERPPALNSPAPRNRSRQGQLPSSSTRRAKAQKGVSAPGRLMEMLPQDTAGTGPPTSAPSRSSGATSPRRPSTSARQSEAPAEETSLRDDNSSPASSSAAASPAGSNKTGTLTPKQKRLWSHLLPSDDLVPHDEAPTPSSLAMRDLRLTGKLNKDDGDMTASHAGERKRQPGLLAKSQSDVSGLVKGGRKRVRLVDRLKASRVSEDEDEEDEEDKMEDVWFSASSQPLPRTRHTDGQETSTLPPGEAAGATSTGPINIANHLPTQHQPHPSNPHPPLEKTAPSAPTTGGTTGAKITYARTRSYLPEDNLEDGLLFSLPSTTTPQQDRPPIPTLPRPKPYPASNKGARTSQHQHQPNALDLNPTDSESDEEISVEGSGAGKPRNSKPARLRTIHELRASGRNARFHREVEGLLEEIGLPPAPQHPPLPTNITSQGPVKAAEDDASTAEVGGGIRSTRALVALARNFLGDVGAAGSSGDGGGGGAGRKGQLKNKRGTKGGNGEGYIGRFLAEGFETRLVGVFSQRGREGRGGVQRRRREGRTRGQRGVGSAYDDEQGDGVEDVGDFALVACFVALLVSPETSVHVLRELGDQRIVGWLVAQLGRTTEVDGLIGRKRGIGLDDSVAGKFGELVEILRGLEGVWDASSGTDGGVAGAPEMMTMRVLCLKALELLVRRSRREGDRREFLSGEQLEKVLLDPSDDFRDEKSGAVDVCTAISLLESLSTSALALTWPEALLHRLSALFPRLATAGTATSQSPSKSTLSRQDQAHRQQEQQHTLFLLYRLTLNLTTDHPRNCAFFATRETFSALLSSIYASFLALDGPSTSSSSTLPPISKPPQSSSPTPTPTSRRRALTLDLLILALGIAINLMTDYSAHANNNSNSTSSAPTLLPRLIDPTEPLSTLFVQLIGIFKSGRARIDRELDSPPPPPAAPEIEKRHTVRSEEASRPQKAGERREREVARRNGDRQGGAADEEGTEEGDDGQLGGGEGEGGDGGGGAGDVGFNIAWGYLAVFLGKCCSFPSASSSEAKAGMGGTEIRQFVAGCLRDDHQDGEGGNGGARAVGQQQQQRRQTGRKEGRGQASGGTEGGLDILVQAVEEFVVYHQRVDGMMMMDHGGGGRGNNQREGSSAARGDVMDEDGMMSGGEKEKDDEEVFAGQEGKEVWSAFTEKLRLVLERLKTVLREDV